VANASAEIANVSNEFAWVKLRTPAAMDAITVMVIMMRSRRVSSGSRSGWVVVTRLSSDRAEVFHTEWFAPKPRWCRCGDLDLPPPCFAEDPPARLLRGFRPNRLFEERKRCQTSVVSVELPPLVLLHGGTWSGDQWRDIAPLLSTHHDVYTPSALGHRGGPVVQRRPVTIWDVIDESER
jgi:pimeloyl-ACP methyl ester carboxylesterase